MATLVLALIGFALLDSLDVLLVGVTTAIIYDARLGRRSPVPGGLGFILGVFATTSLFGILSILGIGFLTDYFDFTVTPKVRYWTELIVGLVLIVASSVPMTARTPPEWSKKVRANPLLLLVVGVVIGAAQAPTAIPYLAGLAMITAQQPLNPLWPLIVIGYCAIALLPPMTILAISTRNTPTARRLYAKVVRFLARFGPRTVRTIFLIAGAALVLHAGFHYRLLH
jgi:cytochrome c biogenesis protein CcdA